MVLIPWNTAPRTMASTAHTIISSSSVKPPCHRADLCGKVLLFISLFTIHSLVNDCAYGGRDRKKHRYSAAPCGKLPRRDRQLGGVALRVHQHHIPANLVDIAVTRLVVHGVTDGSRGREHGSSCGPVDVPYICRKGSCARRV